MAEGLDFEQLANDMLHDYPIRTVDMRDRIVQAFKKVAAFVAEDLPVEDWPDELPE